MKNGLLLFAALLSTSALARQSPEGRLGGVEGRYSAFLAAKLRAWPPPEAATPPPADGNPVVLKCVETEGNKFYIGLEQFMRVPAPLDRVAAVMDDFAHYKDLFPGFDDVHEVSREGSRIVTFWEQHVPVFFIPNVKYEVIYVVDSPTPSRRTYRYQLSKAGTMREDDGLIVIEADGPAATRYTEYDFDDADWGPVTTFAPGRIWSDSVEGIYLSDVAIKLKAEHPDWSYKRIAKESQEILKRYPVAAAIEHKIRVQ